MDATDPAVHRPHAGGPTPHEARCRRNPDGNDVPTTVLNQPLSSRRVIDADQRPFQLAQAVEDIGEGVAADHNVGMIRSQDLDHAADGGPHAE